MLWKAKPSRRACVILWSKEAAKAGQICTFTMSKTERRSSRRCCFSRPQCAGKENRLFFTSEERCVFPMRLQRICAAVTDLPRNRKERNQDMPGVGTEKRPLLIVDGKLLFRDHFQKRQFFHHTVCLLTANTAVTRKNRTFKNIIFASAV